MNNKLIFAGDRWVAWGLYTLAFVVPFLWWDSLLDSSEYPRLVAIEVVGSLLLAALLVRRAWKNAPVQMVVPFPGWPVAIFLMLALLSNAWAHHSGTALISSVHLWGNVTLFALAVYASANSPSFSMGLLRISVLAASCLSVLAIMQNFGYLSILFFQIAPPAATMINKNVFAQYLDTILVPALFLVLVGRSKREVLLRGVAFSLILSCVFISYTRGAWLGMVVGVAFFVTVLWSYSPLRRYCMSDFRSPKLVAIAAAVIFALIVMQLPSSVSSHSFSGKIHEMIDHPEEGSSSFRLSVDQNTWYMLRDHPEGVGIGNWKHVYPMYAAAKMRTTQVNTKTQPEQMHNDPYVFFAELGWLGGIAFLAIFIFSLWATWVSVRKEGCGDHRLLTVALMGALLDVGAHSLVSFPFHSPTSAMQIWLWLGLLGGSAVCLQRGYVCRLSPLFLRISALVSVLIAIFMIVFSVKEVRASVLFKPVYVLSVVKEQVMCSLTSRIDKAHSLFPYDFRIDRSHVIQHLFCDKDRQRVLRLAKAELKKEPYYLNNLINLMPTAFDNKDYDLLEKVAKRLIEFYPWRADGYHGLAVVALQHKNYDAAVSYFRQALEHEPKYAPSLKMLGDLQQQLAADTKGSEKEE